MTDLTDICRCPVSGEPLRWTPEGDLMAASGVRHPCRDGVASFLAAEGDQAAAQEFYESFGWAPDEQGLLGDTKAFVDMRAGPLRFSRRCMERLARRYFSGGGRFLLDAGCGPIWQDEVLALGEGFEKRICIDLSARALRAAQAKLGDRGLYLQADLANLPIQDNVADAVTCNHVIYQLPADLQVAAFRELWRVLRPGGVAVVIYWWSDAPLAWRVEQFARLLPLGGPGRPPDDPRPAPPHHPQTRDWFEAQSWPFSIRYDVFRIIPQLFMRTYISDDWRGRLFLEAVSALQTLAPVWCGKYGAMPAIIIRKD